MGGQMVNHTSRARRMANTPQPSSWAHSQSGMPPSCTDDGIWPTTQAIRLSHAQSMGSRSFHPVYSTCSGCTQQLIPIATHRYALLHHGLHRDLPRDLPARTSCPHSGHSRPDGLHRRHRPRHPCHLARPYRPEGSRHHLRGHPPHHLSCPPRRRCVCRQPVRSALAPPVLWRRPRRI
ncbi:hypothetical protein C8Q76DRAFT_780358, partial [Earliella scabrosa]